MSVIEPSRAETLRDRVDRLRAQRLSEGIDIMPRGPALRRLLGMYPEPLTEATQPEELTVPSVQEADQPQQPAL